MEGYLAEIRGFAGNFAPGGWKFCNGSLLPISEYDALYALIGTTYGGDGQNTFGLPDLRSRVPVGTGQGPGLQNVALGDRAGVESVTLINTQLPGHIHAVTAKPTAAAIKVMASGLAATAHKPSVSPIYALAAPSRMVDGTSTPTLGFNTEAPNTTTNSAIGTMNSNTANHGGSQPHNNLQPLLASNYIICVQGIFPSRS